MALLHANLGGLATLVDARRDLITSQVAVGFLTLALRVAGLHAELDRPVGQPRKKRWREQQASAE